MMKKSVSVVIPVYNGEKTIEKVLESLEKQKYHIDVLIVNDASTDRTERILQKFCKNRKNFRYITNERNLGLAKSLNKGIKNTKGEIVITLHADCVPENEDWVERMVRHFDNPRVAAVTSHNTSDYSGLGLIDRIFLPTYFLLENLRNKPKVRETTSFGDKNDAYRRDVLEKLGYFDETFRVAGEDTDLAKKIMKLGYKIIYEPSPVKQLLSSHQTGLKKHFKKVIQYSESESELFKRYRESTCINHAVLLLVSLLSLGTFFVKNPIYDIAMFIILFVFGLYHRKFFRFLAYVFIFGFLLSFFFGINAFTIIFGGWLIFCLAVGTRIFWYSHKYFDVGLLYAPLGILLLTTREFLKSVGFLKGIFSNF